jgi:DNA-binding NarL/FixJ family response regulator
MKKIKAFVADDHHLVRQGICVLLNRRENITVCGEAADGREAVRQIIQLEPDIAFMDIAMPYLDGIQATRQIASANSVTKIVILSMHSRPHIINQVLCEGARGYLLKESMLEELEVAIKVVIDGHIYLSPLISDQIRDVIMATSIEPGSSDIPLTSREREVLQLIVEGNTNKKVANILSISERTVEKHRSNIMTKLNVSDFAMLVSESIKQGLVFLD